MKSAHARGAMAFFNRSCSEIVRIYVCIYSSFLMYVGETTVFIHIYNTFHLIDVMLESKRGNYASIAMIAHYNSRYVVHVILRGTFDGVSKKSFLSLWIIKSSPRSRR